MSRAAFRIQRLGIEGFKAFAAPQSFEIGGGHVFVFGSNGLGKSSVVEAVRWCLFGLADRAEAEVRNVFYPAGECKVELELEGPGGRWTHQRRLRPGSGRSDPTIRAPSGATVLQTEVFPGLARLGPHEGTHIIFASQQSIHRRHQADITRFDKVLYLLVPADRRRARSARPPGRGTQDTSGDRAAARGGGQRSRGVATIQPQRVAQSYR